MTGRKSTSVVHPLVLYSFTVLVLLFSVMWCANLDLFIVWYGRCFISSSKSSKSVCLPKQKFIITVTKNQTDKFIRAQHNDACEANVVTWAKI